jgi:DNA polymerase elongation subunit (family B)
VQSELRPLRGGGSLKNLAVFATWPEWERARTWLAKSTAGAPGGPEASFLAISDPVQQYLPLSGRAFFENLAFEQLRRMQVDIETYTAPGFEFCNAERESDRIIVIALGDESGWVETLADPAGDEKRLLEQFVKIVRERDPDVIEGHNIFKFDLPYLETRAARHQVPLALGRDGSPIRSHASLFTVGDRVVAFPKFEIAGRQIVDTYFLLQSYDLAHRSLEGFGLKEAAVHFGLAAPERVYLEGADIARTFMEDPKKVLRYAADDIRETRALAAILAQTYFAQAQILPLSFQNVCLRGNAAKIDALLLREYLRREHALPLPEPPRAFEGGYTDIFMEGVIRNVQHCDVRSLYPSIMLAKRLGPRSDELGVFLDQLRQFRDHRMQARKQLCAAKKPADIAHWESMQAAFKILINSFYGYLGFAQARFNDFAAAERVTAEGRAILRGMLDWLKAHGAQPVEIDTDGIYFVPPDFKGAPDEAAFQKAFQASLPEGIEVEFDGAYVAMFSYKMKNYALLEKNGAMTIRGAALKSRGLEPYLRAFLRDYLRLKLEMRAAEIPALRARYEKEIASGAMPIRRLAKTETLKEAPENYAEKIAKKGRGRNAAYELAIRSGRAYRAGDQVSYYITGQKKTVSAHQAAKLVGDWNPAARDENTAYYLAKLQALCARLESGAADDSEPGPE